MFKRSAGLFVAFIVVAVVSVSVAVLPAVAAQVPSDVARMKPFRSGLGVRIENWRAKKGEHPQALKPGFDDSGWRPVAVGRSWKGTSTCWFRTEFTVPEAEAGKALFIEVGVDDAGIVYADGEQLMQFNGFGSALLTKSAEAGRTYTLAIRAMNMGGVGALTVASYRALASEKLISIENALAGLDSLRSIDTVKIDDWIFNSSGGKSNAKPHVETDDWQKIFLPHKIPGQKAFGWYRTEYTIPETVNGFEYYDKPAYLDISVRTTGVLYVNGKKIKSFKEDLKLNIKNKLKPGEKVVLAVKVTDLSSRGGLRSAVLRASKLGPVVELADKLTEKLKRAKLLIEQHPEPPSEILDAVDEIAGGLTSLDGKTDAKQVMAALNVMLRSVEPLEGYLAQYPIFHQGPYLQNSKPDGMTIMWETLVPARAAVYYGKDGLTNVVEDNELKTVHEIVITGLEPETEYKYMAVSNKLAAPQSTFKTSIKRDTPFVFAVWGDNRTDSKSHESVIDVMIPYHPAIALNVGDVVTSGSSYSQWSKEYFLPMRRLAIDTPTYIAIGNHEYGGYGYGNRVLWFEQFVSHPEPNDYYYSFTYGNSFFMILNPQDEPGAHNVRKGTEQYDWMIKQFESEAYKNAAFKFIFFHEPPYSECWSGGYYDGEPAIRANLVPLFEKYKADIIFSGHTHDYERGQWPIPGGPYYIITGGGGSSLDNTKYKEWEQIQYYAFKYHFINVTIDGDHLSFEAIDRNGKVFDSFEMTSKLTTNR